MIDISLKENIVKYGIVYKLHNLKAGKTIKGSIVKHGDKCGFVYIKGSRFIGRLDFSNHF
jgi:hypothetical protein